MLTGRTRPMRTRLPGAAAKHDREQLEVFWFKLELLLEGARRHARPFGLTRFCFATPHERALFVAENRGRVRACDAIGEIADAAVVAWDDADRDLAQTAATRLQRSTATCSPVDVTTASFPDDGLTISALISALREPDERVHRLDGNAGTRPTGRRSAWDRTDDEERAS